MPIPPLGTAHRLRMCMKHAWWSRFWKTDEATKFKIGGSGNSCMAVNTEMLISEGNEFFYITFFQILKIWIVFLMFIGPCIILIVE